MSEHTTAYPTQTHPEEHCSLSMHLENVEFNPLVQQDVRNMLSYFDRISGVVGDKVFEDFTNRIDQISKNPYRFPPFHRLA